MASSEPHSDSMLMIPPPGFKFIPRFEAVCGKPGCFECFDIYCERCESKDRRIIELEMRNNDLIKYITQLQGRMFGSQTRQGVPPAGGPTATQMGGGASNAQMAFRPTDNRTMQQPPQSGGPSPFAYIQSPVLYDPNLSLSYVATTTFSPAGQEPRTGNAPPRM